MDLQIKLFFFFLLVSLTEAKNGVFNVMDYGAVADGKTDSSKAFSKAWLDACKLSNSSVLVPPGTYFSEQVSFTGPCSGPIAFVMKGVLKAPTGPSSRNTDNWIAFRYINRLTLSGGGVFDGQGASAWPYNKCNVTTKCIRLPTSLRFDFVNNSKIYDVTSKDSKSVHMNLFKCSDMEIHDVTISAPADSPNTDGIHIGISKSIHIRDSNIGTGDDCVSLSPGSINVEIVNVYCGPGHGISVGSLGGGRNEEPVSGLSVRNCTFNGTDNGVRIKTKAPSQPGNVFNLTFANLGMFNVYNPVIIDQQYCPLRNCDRKSSSQVQIEDVKLNNIWGTSRSKVAVNLQCSSGKPCKKIELRDINLEHYSNDGKAISSCSNVQGHSYGQQNPSSCI